MPKYYLNGGDAFRLKLYIDRESKIKELEETLAVRKISAQETSGTLS